LGYRFVLEAENHEDLASGRVLRSAPGFPAFPVRLAGEMFHRALALSARDVVTLWDPCCGSAHLLTVLSLMHRRRIHHAVGTDIDTAALELARRNLALLSGQGLAARAAELRERAELFEKPSYTQAAAAAQRLARGLEAEGGDLPHTLERADVFDPDQLRRALAGRRPDVVITDVPYGEKSSWSGGSAATGITGMLRSLSAVLDDEAVIAVSTRGRKVPVDARARRIAAFRVGTRAVALFRPAR